MSGQNPDEFGALSDEQLAEFLARPVLPDPQGLAPSDDAQHVHHEPSHAERLEPVDDAAAVKAAEAALAGAGVGGRTTPPSPLRLPSLSVKIPGKAGVPPVGESGGSGSIAAVTGRSVDCCDGSA